MVDPWCVGYFTPQDAASNGRLAMPILWLRDSKGDDNGYSRAVVNVEALVEMYEMKVLWVKDRGFSPIPPADPLRHWTSEQLKVPMRDDIKPLIISQPEGPSFTVVGNKVYWQGWQFRVGFTPTEGLVLTTVAIEDQ